MMLSLLARSAEHIPLLGHLLAAVYYVCGFRHLVGRALVKATLGIILPFNFILEILDEIFRDRTTPKKANSLSHRPKWMHRYHRKRLHHLVLPGSQNSATASIHSKLTWLPLETAWNQCQVLTVAEQLMGGIRFLDLRLMSHPTHREHEVWVYNNDVMCIRLDDVLRQVCSFVMTYTSEVVCIYMNGGGRFIDWECVQQCITAHLDTRLITSDMTDMSIGDITTLGKNVALFGMPDISDAWNLVYMWPNARSPLQLQDNLATSLHRNFILQDPPALTWYFGICEISLAMKIRDLGGLQGLLASRNVDEKYAFRLGLGRAANQAVWQVLQSVSTLPFNIITTDIVDDDIVDRIISCNRAASQGFVYVSNKIGEMERIPMSSLEENELERMRIAGEKMQRAVCLQSMYDQKAWESHV